MTVDIKTDDKIITLQNIYAQAPNNDDLNFFKSVIYNLPYPLSNVSIWS